VKVLFSDKASMNEGAEDSPSEVGEEDSMPWGAFNPYFSFLKQKDNKNFDCICKPCQPVKRVISVSYSTSQNLKSHLKVS
jgi:hypothetical protein